MHSKIGYRFRFYTFKIKATKAAEEQQWRPAILDKIINV